MKTNLQTRKLISALKKEGQKVKLWRRVADELERPTRQLPSVNLVKLSKYIRDGEIALVPGKVLSTGTLGKKMTVAAFQFSEAAREKISEAKGEAISLEELLQKNPRGNNVRILK